MEKEVTALDLKKAEHELDIVKRQIQEATHKLQTLRSSRMAKIDEYVSKEQSKIVEKQQRQVSAVTQFIEQDKQETIDLITNLFQENEPITFSDVIDTEQFVSYLSDRLSNEQIAAYEPSGVPRGTNIDSVINILNCYTEKEKKDSVVKKISDAIMRFELPENSTPQHKIGTSIAAVVAGIVACGLLSPFTVYGLAATFIAENVRGKKYTDAMNLYDAANSYFKHDSASKELNKEKEKLISDVNDYYKKIQDKTVAKIEKLFNTDVDTSAFEQQLIDEENVARNNLVLLSEKSKGIMNSCIDIKNKLDGLEKLRLQEAKSKEDSCLTFSSFDWKKELLKEIYVGKNKKGLPIILNTVIGNCCFYSTNIDYLFNMIRLISLQFMMHMHPDYIEQVLIDYKHMGGILQPLSTLPERCYSMCFEQETIVNKLTDVTNEITLRVKNVLSTVSNIEEFNTLMTKLGGTAYSYTIVHVVGLQNLTESLQYLLQNGQKVGFFFYFYLTEDELKQIVKPEFIDLINEFYQLSGDDLDSVVPARRLKSVIRTYLKDQK